MSPMRNPLALGVHAALTDAEIVTAPEPAQGMTAAQMRKVNRTDADIWGRIQRREAKLARRGRLAK